MTGGAPLAPPAATGQPLHLYCLEAFGRGAIDDLFAAVDAAPFEPSRKLGDALLTPTRLYVRACLAAMRATRAVKALAHITGGGFIDNIPRVLPPGFSAAVELSRVPVLPVFKWLAATGKIGEMEMLRTFNCGIGMIAILEADGADAACARFAAKGETVVRLGEVVKGGARTVEFRGQLDLAG